MILSCNSCEKKFVVPDKAITISGRLVQCGSCGNKWKQFPEKIDQKKELSKPNFNLNKEKIKNITKIKKLKKNKKKSFNLYSPEYLAKKHGININDSNDTEKNLTKKSISFGFYNSLILLIVVFITLSRSLYFFEDVIVKNFPISEFYLNYFFESLKNISEIIKNLISSY
tara:strand:- start:140 stop:649 length:510 start_codon:yes stop_codon:yes gene_type:complete